MIESVAEFVRLRESEDPAEYRRAAAEPASLEVWREVVASRPDLRFWVAHNKTVPLEILRDLASDPDPRVRAMVADKRKLDAELFERLAGDPDADVRARLASNAKAPRAVLERLAADGESIVAEPARERLSRP
jgi:hypothetical protein